MKVKDNVPGPIQNYSRIYSYVDEYWNKVYQYYAAHGLAFQVTYYNLDIPVTVWDNVDLMGGYYEKIGELSGVRWRKILLFPGFQIGETSNIFEADETGYINKGESEIVVPSVMGVTPYPNDIIMFNHKYLSINTYPGDWPIYCVTGVQKQSPQDRTFWKLSLKIEQSRTSMDVDKQVSNTYTYFDYTKGIYSVENAISMTRLMKKNGELKTRMTSLIDQNSGYLFC